MKKLITLALVGMLAFCVVGPAAAKKKKPKPAAPVPVEVQFFLRTDEDCVLTLSLVDGEDPSDCYYGIDDMLNEYPQTQIDPVFSDQVDHYVTADGVPLTLDPTRKITGSVTVQGWGPLVGGPGVGVGQAAIDLTVKATIAGEEKEVGTFTYSYTAGPDQKEQVDFEIAIDPAFAGAVAESLTLDVWTHGNVILARGLDHDSEVPPSIKVPALK